MFLVRETGRANRVAVLSRDKLTPILVDDDKKNKH